MFLFFFLFDQIFLFQVWSFFLPVHPPCLSASCCRAFYIFLEVFAADSSFFVLKIPATAAAADAPGTFFNILNIFFKVLVLFYNQIVTFFCPLKYFFASAILSLSAMAFLYSSKFFSMSSNKKVFIWKNPIQISSRNICTVPFFCCIQVHISSYSEIWFDL